MIDEAPSIQRQDVVRPAERSKVAAIGTTTIDEWMGKVMSGDKGV